MPFRPSLDPSRFAESRHRSSPTQYLAIPYTNLRRPPITLAALERARTQLSAKGRTQPLCRCYCLKPHGSHSLSTARSILGGCMYQHLLKASAATQLLLYAMILAGCETLTIVAPAPNVIVSSPVPISVTWAGTLVQNNLQVTENGVVVANLNVANATNNNISGTLPTLANGPHNLVVSADFMDSYTNQPVLRSASVQFIVQNTAESVACSVFDDNGANVQGPSNAIFISGRDGAKACVPGGEFGVCRKAFGQCMTTTTGKQVEFYLFDDGYTNVVGPFNAVQIDSGNSSACTPDWQTTPVSTVTFPQCRKWFGLAYTSDGRNVTCNVFDDGFSDAQGSSNAIFIPKSLPDAGVACIPNGTAQGDCRRWFGQCSTVVGVPIVYTLQVTSQGTGDPSGNLGALQFGSTTSHPNVNLTFTFAGNTANIVAFYAPDPLPFCGDFHCAYNDGQGYMITIGTATVTVTDAMTNAVLATANFLPGAGIFISIDNGNFGIGFGSQGVLPTDLITTPPPGSPQPPQAVFPGQVAYPFGSGFLGGSGSSPFNLQSPGFFVLPANTAGFGNLSVPGFGDSVCPFVGPGGLPYDGINGTRAPPLSNGGCPAVYLPTDHGAFLIDSSYDLNVQATWTITNPP